MSDIEMTLADRQKTHGSFAVHAQTTQLLKATINSKLTDRGVWLSDEHQEALDMICHKIGRIVAGNPDNTDHWHDIAGYATLGEKACTKTSI